MQRPSLVPLSDCLNTARNRLTFADFIEAKREAETVAVKIANLNQFDLDGSNAPAEEFLVAAGPKVVPALIHGLRMRDNYLSGRWYDFNFKLGKWQHYFQVLTKRFHFRANCATGLGLLGQAASNAVPALLRSLEDKNPYRLRIFA